jgi:GNAT superfamily N-acetyltransferase
MPERDLTIRPAAPEDTRLVSAILHEASAWADSAGGRMWEAGELETERLAAEVAQGLFHLAWLEGDAAGTVKFQLEDEEFWPDLPDPRAAYVHRLAVLRRYAGRGVSTALLSWAAAHARALGREVLRLDCDAHRTSLRGVYERFGFTCHSYRQVGPYYVARYELPLGVSR